MVSRLSIVAASGAALMLALAAPAAADPVYHWRTDDGGYAFTDDPRRIPERYRERAEMRESSSVRQHSRYTPQDEAATAAHAKQLEERLAAMRRRQSEEQQLAALLSRVAPADEGKVTVRLSSNGEPIIDIPNQVRGGSKPVVIEDVTALPDGANGTRTNRIIRQGDEIIAILRGVHPNQTLYYPRESEFEGGLFHGEYD